MKKILSGIMVVIMAVCMVVGLTGCEEERLPEYETEYFRYAVRTNRDGSKEGYLVGFTELGAEQTELILPEEINGVPMVGFGYERKLGWGTEAVGEFINPNLKKLYIPFVAKVDTWSSFNSFGYLENGSVVQWKSANIWIESLKVINGFSRYWELFQNGYFRDSRTHYNNLLANISYMYNYEGAEDDGCYWVDSYDNEVVSFIPPEPTREGYRFGGWYKESECLNAWDFAKDKTGKELEIDMTRLGDTNQEPQYTENDGIKLYAKWEKE